MRQLILKGIVILVAVAGLATILAPQDAQACVPGTQAWCNEPERVAYYTCGGENTGTMWFNRQGGPYFTDTVSVGHDETSVPVGLRGSVWPCGNYMGNSGVWAVNVAPSGANAWRLTGLSSTTLYRGSFQNNSWAWTTQGGTINATLNLAGIPANTSPNPVAHSLTVDIYRCYSSNGTGVTGSCYPTPVPITVIRQGRPPQWNVNAQSYIKKVGPSAPANSATGYGQTNITAAPGDVLNYAHDLRAINDNINTQISYTLRGTGFPDSFRQMGQPWSGPTTLLHGAVNPTIANNNLFVRLGSIPSYNPSYTVYTVTQNDVGNNLCQRIEWGPTAWNNGGNSGTTARCANVPYNYNLIPSITNLATSTVIESDSKTVDVIGRVNNNGPTKSRTNVQWQLTQLRYAPGVASIPQVTGGLGGNPCSFFTGEANCTSINNGTVAAGYSYPGSATYPSTGQLNNEPAGTKICYAMSVRPYNQSTSDWRHSQLYCLIVGKKPKVQVWGGDVSVGKSQSGTPYNTSANVITSLATKQGATSTTILNQPGRVTGLVGAGSGTPGQKDPNWRLLRIEKNGNTNVSSHCQTDPVNTFATITNGSTPALGSNLTGENQYTSTCPFLGMATSWQMDGESNRTPLPNDAVTWVYRLTNGFNVEPCVNLDTIRINIRHITADDDLEIRINGKVVSSFQESRNLQPEFIIDSSVARYRSVITLNNKEIGPIASDGTRVFQHGNNSFEVRVKSAWRYTSFGMNTSPVAITAECSSTATAERSYGSWTEYGIFAPSSISLMASASGLSGGSVSSIQSSWSNYSFTKKTDGTYGQYTSTKQTLPDVTTNFPTASAVVESNWNLSTTAKGRNIRPADAVSSITLTANAGVTLGSGQWLVVNAVGKNVTIANNLMYANGSFTSARNIPQLIIIADNITINHDVDRVDAWLIARNAISTCEQQSSGSGTGQWLSSGSNYTSSSARLVIGPSGHCTNALRINGPVIASKLYLRRTAGSGTNEQAGDPAEVINLRPDAYLWANEWMNPLRAYRTTNVTELPPRY